MIHYRAFRNTDPPGLAEVWRSQPPLHGLALPVTPGFLETLVFAKPYFEHAGLVVAEENGKLVGFVHAGFGANDSQTALDYSLGAICLLMVSPHEQRREIGRELLARGESYLRSRGARVLYGGSLFPLNPFYLGLYGGSELPGVLAEDEFLVNLYQAAGYGESERVAILERTLAGFRPPVDRRQLNVRRNFQIVSENDPPTRTWWEACTYGPFTRTRFSLKSATGETSCSATFWDLEPLASCWGVAAAGLIQLETGTTCRRQGLGTFLIAESLKQLQSAGVSVVQVQTMQSNSAALGLYDKLGFQSGGAGILFRKPADMS